MTDVNIVNAVSGGLELGDHPEPPPLADLLDLSLQSDGSATGAVGFLRAANIGYTFIVKEIGTGLYSTNDHFIMLHFTRNFNESEMK